MNPRLVPSAATILVAVLVGACAASTATTAPTGTSAPVSSTAATEAPTEAASQVSDAPSEPASSLPDLSAIFGSVDLLDSLERYDIAVEITGASGTTTMDVTTIRKPVVATKVDMVTSGTQISIVRVGDKAWVKQGSTAAYLPVPVATVATLTNVLAPEKLFASFRSQEAFKYLTSVGAESKNGVQATHYHVDDQTTLPPGSATIPPGAVGDVWVAEEGYLVALEVSGVNSDVAGQGKIDSMKVEVTHINDPALQVEQPG